jgi:hypothetical protein
MEAKEKTKKAAKVKRQGKTTKNRESDIDKKTMQAILADVDQLKSFNNQDFKYATIEIIKELIEWCMELQRHHQKEIEGITITLKDRFKIMDETITDLVRFRQGIEDLRFVLLFNTARYDYAFDVLVKMGLIERQAKEIYHNIWNDKRISMLGFECSAEELKEKMADSLKTTELTKAHD